jgi:hypothetical protein
MKNIFNIALLPLFFSLAVFLQADGEEKGGAGQYPTVQVTGLVRLVGNEPFTELVISTDDNAWFIEGSERYKLNNLQYRTVTVKGIENVIELTFASGIPAGERRTLRDIEIIKVE